MTRTSDRLSLAELLAPWDAQTLSVTVHNICSGSKPGADVIRHLIARAKKSIYIATYVLLDPKIEEMLRRQAARGVVVHVLHDAATPTRALDVPGITYHAFGTMHAKVIVVDRRLVYLGSHNLTQAALSTNVESGVIIESRTLAIIYESWIGELVND
jgi:phosphatidylserine/phosphatidylglycerophosphate/cardiolipin synthase-like enzyme